MKTIWKYPLKIQHEQTIEMPIGARILCVQMQHDTPCLWVEVDPGCVQPRRIYIFGTGHDMHSLVRQYIGTVQTGGLVWHVYTGK